MSAKPHNERYSTEASSESQLRLVIETIPALVWSATPEGAADFVNKRWTQYTGLSLDETKGLGWAMAIHPDDRLAFADRFKKALITGNAYEDEGRIRGGDGQYRRFLVRATPLSDEFGKIIKWYGTCTDIEDLKQAEYALRYSEQRFRDFSHAASDWYWETGPDHRFTYLPSERPEYARVAPNAIGFGRWELAADVEKEPIKWSEHLATLREHRPFRNFTYLIVLKDESAMYCAVSGVPVFDEHGRFLGYRGSASDVTAIVHAAEAEKDLRKAQLELSHVTRISTLGELTASIAHEVNQPLAGIAGNGTACLRWLNRDPPRLDEVRASIEAMISDCNRASSIITKVRALAKKAEPQRTAIDINDVIQESVALVQRELDSHNVALVQELSPNLPAVSADRVELQQVIINLVMNGIESMDEVTTRRREMLIRSDQYDDKIVVEVQDCGTGIDPAGVEKLFEPFITTKPEGLGLGLSISRSIIEAHGGRLTATSAGNLGATFKFMLPSHRTAL
jgi:PAS domain S-box-containing protein